LSDNETEICWLFFSTFWNITHEPAFQVSWDELVMLAQPNFAWVSGSLLLPIFNSLPVSELNSHPTFIALDKWTIFIFTYDFFLCVCRYIPDWDNEAEIYRLTFSSFWNRIHAPALQVNWDELVMWAQPNFAWVSGSLLLPIFNPLLFSEPNYHPIFTVLYNSDVSTPDLYRTLQNFSLLKTSHGNWAQPNLTFVSGSSFLPIFNSLLVSELNSHPTFIALNERTVFTFLKDFTFIRTDLPFDHISDSDDWIEKFKDLLNRRPHRANKANNYKFMYCDCYLEDKVKHPRPMYYEPLVEYYTPKNKQPRMVLVLRSYNAAEILLLDSSAFWNMVYHSPFYIDWAEQVKLAQPTFELVSGSLHLPICNSLLDPYTNPHPTSIALNEQTMFTFTEDVPFIRNNPPFDRIYDLNDKVCNHHPSLWLERKLDWETTRDCIHAFWVGYEWGTIHYCMDHIEWEHFIRLILHAENGDEFRWGLTGPEKTFINVMIIKFLRWTLTGSQWW